MAVANNTHTVKIALVISVIAAVTVFVCSRLSVTAFFYWPTQVMIP